MGNFFDKASDIHKHVQTGLNWFEQQFFANIWLVDGSQVTHAINTDTPAPFVSQFALCHHSVHIVMEVELQLVQATAHHLTHLLHSAMKKHAIWLLL